MCVPLLRHLSHDCWMCSASVPVHISANLKTETIEQLRDRKRITHMTSFSLLIDELKREMWDIARERDLKGRVMRDTTKMQDGTFTAETFVTAIIGQAQEVFDRQNRTDAKVYVEDVTYRNLMNEMLNVKRWAKHKLLHYLQDASQYICASQSRVLGTSHRAYIGYLLRRLGRIDLAAVHEVAPQTRQYALDLLKAKALVTSSIDDVDDTGESLLEQAAADGWSALDFTCLLLAGCDIDRQDNDGYTALMIASQFGHADCVTALIAAKCDLDKQDNDRLTALMYASRNDHTDCAIALIAAKCDLDKQDNDGWTALMYASRKGNTDCETALNEGQ